MTIYKILACEHVPVAGKWVCAFRVGHCSAPNKADAQAALANETTTIGRLRLVLKPVCTDGKGGPFLHFTPEGEVYARCGWVESASAGYERRVLQYIAERASHRRIVGQDAVNEVIDAFTREELS